jgi:phage FluMu protein Com
MSYATCSICGVEGEFVERTHGNVEMKCPSCDMWVNGFYTEAPKKLSNIKNDAKNKYNEKISTIIQNKVDYYNKKQKK